MIEYGMKYVITLFKGEEILISFEVEGVDKNQVASKAANYLNQKGYKCINCGKSIQFFNDDSIKIKMKRLSVKEQAVE